MTAWHLVAAWLLGNAALVVALAWRYRRAYDEVVVREAATLVSEIENYLAGRVTGA